MNVTASTNPWLTGDQVRNPGTMKTTVTDRLEKIRWSTDLSWLRKVVAWRDNQLTVRKAAERRMRTVSKHSQDPRENAAKMLGLTPKGEAAMFGHL